MLSNHFVMNQVAPNLIAQTVKRLGMSENMWAVAVLNTVSTLYVPAISALSDSRVRRVSMRVLPENK